MKLTFDEDDRFTLVTALRTFMSNMEDGLDEAGEAKQAYVHYGMCAADLIQRIDPTGEVKDTFSYDDIPPEVR